MDFQASEDFSWRVSLFTAGLLKNHHQSIFGLPRSFRRPIIELELAYSFPRRIPLYFSSKSIFPSRWWETLEMNDKNGLDYCPAFPSSHRLARKSCGLPKLLVKRRSKEGAIGPGKVGSIVFSRLAFFRYLLRASRGLWASAQVATPYGCYPHVISYILNLIIEISRPLSAFWVFPLSCKFSDLKANSKKVASLRPCFAMMWFISIIGVRTVGSMAAC